jgi:large subunit ribosomal protein L9
MKVVLLTEVKPLGKAGTVVHVSDGYARNYLLPKELADEATKGTIERFEQQELAKRLEGMVLSIPVKAGGNGRLFGAVTNTQVAHAIHEEFQVEVDRHKIEVPENIKSLGSYAVEIKLAKNVIAKTTVKVVAAAN